MTQELVLDNNTQSAKELARWLYIIHGLCLVFSLGTLSVLPLIVNYLKRGDVRGTWLESHHRWQIRSFWWYAFWAGAAFLLSLTVIGIPIAILIATLAWIWKAYRIIKGFIDLNDNKAMPV